MANPSPTPAQLEKLRMQRHSPSQAPVLHRPALKAAKLADYERIRAMRKAPSQAPANKTLKVAATRAGIDKLRAARPAPSQAKSLIRIPK